MYHEDSFLIQKTPAEEMNLPPGFRFHPTDEELITHYLSNKVLNSNFNAIAITEVDLNKCEPWDLPSKILHSSSYSYFTIFNSLRFNSEKSKLGEKESYFYSLRGRKYPTGLRTNRATKAGYWKATGKDKEIRREKITIGMKKTLVFYRGRAPKGVKTDWIMHEYRLEGNYAMNEWVICKIVKKRSVESGKKASCLAKIGSWSPSFEEEIIVQGAPPSPLMDAHVSCFSNSFFHDADFKSSLEASIIFQEMGLSIAMNTEISFDNEVGRYSLEECQWNC